MRNKKILLSLAALLLLAFVPAQADDSDKSIFGDEFTLHDFKGNLTRWGLKPNGAGDITVKRDLTVTRNFVVTGTQTYTGNTTFNGTVEINGDITLENDEILANEPDGTISFTANDDATEVMDFQFKTSNTAGGDNDYIRLSYWFIDDGAVSDEVAYMDVSMDDETSNTLDSTIEWAVTTNDTTAAELNLTGAMLFPEANAGLDLGSDTYEFGSIWIDTTAYLDEANVTELVVVKASTSLTSPSVAIDLAGGTWFEINTDANQTGATLSNGVVGQVYTITMGSGSNTLRFDDDALNLALGGNITLTEGEADALILLCYATGDFLCLSDRSGN